MNRHSVSMTVGWGEAALHSAETQQRKARAFNRQCWVSRGSGTRAQHESLGARSTQPTSDLEVAA